MILIGMLDSPFVRRVAVSMKRLGMPFEHRNWSVGKDQMLIRQYNPVGRVPTLVLGNNEALMESAAILDHLDQQAGPERALLPAGGESRRRALHCMALAIGAAEKGVAQIYEGAFRPEEKRHQPWVDRCREQMEGGLAELERLSAAQSSAWLLGTALTQADITVACVFTFLRDTLNVDARRFPTLAARTTRCEQLPEFAATYTPFFTPQSKG